MFDDIAARVDDSDCKRYRDSDVDWREIEIANLQVCYANCDIATSYACLARRSSMQIFNVVLCRFDAKLTMRIYRDVSSEFELYLRLFDRA